MAAAAFSSFSSRSGVALNESFLRGPFDRRPPRRLEASESLSIISHHFRSTESLIGDNLTCKTDRAGLRTNLSLIRDRLRDNFGEKKQTYIEQRWRGSRGRAMSDPDDFDWTAENPDVVVRRQDNIAVYENTAGDVVIRREQSCYEMTTPSSSSARDMSPP